jgi:type II secretory pathway pseudopilin PulG
MRRDAGITIVEVAAAMTIVGIVVALVIPAWTRSSRFEQVLECQARLKALHAASLKAPAPAADQVGGAYWVRLTKTTPPLLDESALRCPLVHDPAAPACHYLGPATDPAKADAKDPIGSDRIFNHSSDEKQGGNVLLKNGSVVTDHTGTWGAAVRHGKCRP